MPVEMAWSDVEDVRDRSRRRQRRHLRRSPARNDADIVGIALRAEKKTVDKTVKGARMHP